MPVLHRSQLGSYPEPAEVAASGQRLSVMVVDDDDDSRGGMMLAMESLGHSCLAAKDGLEALQLYRDKHRHIDVVVSDWRMPRMNGIELCRAIRAEADRYVYFVFATALADKAHLLEGMGAGADDYLSKPLDLEQLAARLLAAQRVIGLHRALSMRNRVLRRDSEHNFRAARIDPLTCVHNRLALMEDLEHYMTTSSRYAQRYCLAMCDVDHFKAYNDHFGHLKGDEALKLVAEVIGKRLRKSDVVYRYGGEEFVVTLPQQTPDSAALAMDRVRRAVEEAALPHAPGAAYPVVTISVGIAELGIGGADASLKKADEAMYRAKNAGRNRVAR
ncbi:MAG TPA: diguanylate cyclase [Polyangiaceae bacterium]